MDENNPPIPAGLDPDAGLGAGAEYEGAGEDILGAEELDEDTCSLGVGPKDWTNPCFFSFWKDMLS